MRLLVAPAAACLCLALLGAGCGGSSSESPWPVEPDRREGAPLAEVAAPGTPTEERTPESRGEVSADGPRRRDDADAGVTPAPTTTAKPARKKP